MDNQPIVIIPKNSNLQKQKMIPTLCLSMIVKNEENNIISCLESVADHLDYWIIHDTGSSDKTKEIIINFFQSHQIPGELYQTSWKNFSWNRNQALKIAKTKADYCLLLDADFIVNINDKTFKSSLSANGYLITYEGNLDYRQILLVNSKHNWQYYGVTHEYIQTTDPKLPVEITNKLTILHTQKGESRQNKHDRDEKLLLDGIKEEPENSRYLFYLAQTYKAWEKYDQAIEYYQKRLKIKNIFIEEEFYSLYMIGVCKRRRGDDFYQYLGDFLEAYHYRPTRIEPIYQIMEGCLESNKNHQIDLGYHLGFLYQQFIYPTDDLLFIEKPLYQWMYLDILALCAYKSNHFVESLEFSQRLLTEKKYPAHLEQRFKINIAYLKKKNATNDTLKETIQ